MKSDFTILRDEQEVFLMGDRQTKTAAVKDNNRTGKGRKLKTTGKKTS
jgi:hypothetical protein